MEDETFRGKREAVDGKREAGRGKRQTARGRRHAYLFPLAALLLAAGCATPEKRLMRHPELVANLPAPQLQDIKAGRVETGFDMEKVRLALGRPDRIAMRPIDDKGMQEVWTYQLYQDAEGSPLYRGDYHRFFAGGDPRYPFYLDVPDRRVDGTIQVVFNGKQVIEVEDDARTPVTASARDLK